MTAVFHPPLLADLIPGGIEYGTVVLVEFESQSCWYDVAYTLAAQSLRAGKRTDLHIFQHDTKEVRQALLELGLDLPSLQHEDLLRVIDSYSVQVGVGSVEVPKGADAFKTQSVRLEDWARAAVGQMAAGIPPSEKQRLHIDDNTAILTRYNPEEAVVDYWRTKIVPLYKARESILVNAVALGVASPSFYHQQEAMSDAILDCKTEEGAGGIVNLLRVRSFRGKTPDSRWHTLRQAGHEVSLKPRGEASRGWGGPDFDRIVGHDPKTEGSRTLAAIVFTDMVGSTQLSGRNEPLALGLRNEQREMVGAATARFGGRLVKTVGDGCLMMFPSTLEATRCALALQSSFEKRNASAEVPLQLRIGIHVGEVFLEENDIAGHGVDIASRVEPLARPGGVSVSRSAYEQLRTFPEFSFESLGPMDLKGAVAPIEVFHVVASDRKTALE